MAKIKVKIGILTIGDNYESSPILGYFKELENKYHTKTYLIYPENIKYVYSGIKKNSEDLENNKSLYYNNKKINLDVIVPRISSSTTINQFLFAINAMDYIRNYTNIPLINYTKGMLISNDKFWQSEYVASHGYRIPKTIFVSNKNEINNSLKEFNKYPLIVKNQYGSEGTGVALVESERSARSVISSMIVNYNGAIVQEYLPVESGQDLRVYVVGGKVVKGIIRTAAKGDFRANVTSLGGRKKSFKPDKELRRMAIEIANIVGLEITAVDFMQHNGKYYFLEINKNPGTKNDIKTAETIFQYIIERGKKKIKSAKALKKKYNIKDIDDVKRVFKDLDVKIFGVGIKAFRRIVPTFVIPDYGILSYKNTNDLSIINQYTTAKSMQDQDLDYINYHQSITPGETVEYAYIENYLRKFNDVHLMIYETTPQIEKIIEHTNSAVVFANKIRIKNKYENKLYFRKFLNKIGINLMPYKNFDCKAFLKRNYHSFINDFGNWFVVQLPETTSGGGKNTFIIKDKKTFSKVQRIVRARQYRGEKIESVDVIDYLAGQALSLNCCVTKQGVLTGDLGIQLIDIAEVRNKKSLYRGKYCGNEWNPDVIDEDLRQRARKIAIKIGIEMQKRSNYKGLFGLDFIYNSKKDLMVPIECNPRPTGGLASEDLIGLTRGIIPLESFQLLESFNINYQYPDKIIKKYLKFKRRAANLYLYNRHNHLIKLNNDIKAGIYSFNRNGKIKFIKDSLRFQDLCEEDQFILAESISSSATTVVLEDDTAQILRLIFPTTITINGGQLKPVIKKIVKNIYLKLGI